MYNITLPILGTRLKQIREHIGYSQAQLAEQLNCKQNAISNLELGKGGSLKLLFQVLNFYSNYVFIDLIFSEKFYLISNTEEDEAQKANYNSVIIEIIQKCNHFLCRCFIFRHNILNVSTQSGLNRNLIFLIHLNQI